MRYAKLILTNAVVALIGLIVVAPLLWMVAAAFMPRGTAQTYPAPLWPAEPTLDNFRELFTRLHLGRYLLNSLAISLAITGFGLLLNAMAGYAFAKLRFSGRERVFRTWRLYLTCSAVAFESGSIGLYQVLMRKHGDPTGGTAPRTRERLYPPGLP